MSKDVRTAGSGSKLITFEHEDMPWNLHIKTGINDVEWGYTLNTAVFPTYGGEVVQILSASVEQMNIGGDIQKYEDMYNIYTYFFIYFQLASQGAKVGAAAGIQSYNQKHMKMKYPERDWEFDLQPTTAPGFHVGREVVVPSWRMTAHVDHFLGADLADQIKAEARAQRTLESFDAGNLADHKSNKDLSFFKLREGVGYLEANPFSDPFSSVTNMTNDVYQTEGQKITDANTEYYKLLGPAYSQGDFQSLLYGFDSNPATGASGKNIDNLKDAVKNDGN